MIELLSACSRNTTQSRAEQNSAAAAVTLEFICERNQGRVK